MQVLPIKTRRLLPPKDDLMEVLDVSLPPLRERDVVVITSKVVAIGEGRCVLAGTPAEKKQLIAQEADYLASAQGNRDFLFSVKGHTVVGFAGIDDSNGNGYWILWPKDPFASAKKIWKHIRKKYSLTEIGVVITDSVSSPMRFGTVGISIGFFGIHPVVSHIGKTDIFGRKFKFSRSNLVDGIASSAVTTMGETDEQCPIAVVRDVPALRFASRDTSRELFIEPKQDIYYPLLKSLYAKKS